MAGDRCTKTTDILGACVVGIFLQMPIGRSCFRFSHTIGLTENTKELTPTLDRFRRIRFFVNALFAAAKGNDRKQIHWMHSAL